MDVGRFQENKNAMKTCHIDALGLPLESVHTRTLWTTAPAPRAQARRGCRLWNSGKVNNLRLTGGGSKMFQVFLAALRIFGFDHPRTSTGAQVKISSPLLMHEMNNTTNVQQ